jgi:hypothetical protein
MTSTTQAPRTPSDRPRKHWSGIAGCWCCYSHSIREAFDLNYPEDSAKLEAGMSVQQILTQDAGR